MFDALTFILSDNLSLADMFSKTVFLMQFLTIIYVSSSCFIPAIHHLIMKAGKFLVPVNNLKKKSSLF